MAKATEQLENFLAANAVPELARLYWPGMTVFAGKTVKEGDKEGFMPIVRIPNTKRGVSDENRQIAVHKCERIGVSGWDYRKKTSHFVSIDVDLGGTKKKEKTGVSEERMDEIIAACVKLPYLEVRRSTHGKGLLLRAFIEAFPTANEDAHAALADQVVNCINTDTTLALTKGADIDATGHIAWIWSSKQSTDSFKLLSAHKEIFQPMRVVEVKNVLEQIPLPGLTVSVEGMEEQAFFSRLSDTTKSALEWVKTQGHYEFATHEEHKEGEPSKVISCVKTHTALLARAHKQMNLSGKFATDSSGSDTKSRNCFCLPSINGGLRVVRYGTGSEKEWLIDDKGRAYSFFNDSPPMAQIVAKHFGQRDSSGNFMFDKLSDAICTVNYYAKKKLETPSAYADRKATMVVVDNFTIQLRVDKIASGEKSMYPNWFNGHGYIKTSVDVDLPEEMENAVTMEELGLLKEKVRHVAMHYQLQNSWWEIKSQDRWIPKGRVDINSVVSAEGIKAAAIGQVCGLLLRDSFFAVDIPFSNENLGPNILNITKAKFVVEQKAGETPTWTKFLRHVGASLDTAIAIDPVLNELGITDGEQYLKMWLALSIRQPILRLPYLFLFGPQESGKSLFHESLRNIISRESVQSGTLALTNERGFNEELQGATHVFLEEVDLSRTSVAYTRMKDLVTSPELCCHPKGGKPMMVPNYTHWIHVTNNIQFCPIESADTRITMIEVLKPANPQPKVELMAALKAEAPAFLHSLMTLSLPAHKGRMGLPIVATADRSEVMEAREDNAKLFIRDCVMEKPGAAITVAEAMTAYMKYCEQLNGPNRFAMGRNIFLREVRKHVMVGRNFSSANQMILANVCLIERPQNPSEPFVRDTENPDNLLKGKHE